MEHNRFPGDQYLRLMQRVHEGHASDETIFKCSVDDRDHLHVRRLGDENEGDAGRVGLLIHSDEGFACSAFFSPSEARVIAASLLDHADELDGAPPMTYVQPPDAPGSSDEVEVDFGALGFNIEDEETDEDDENTN